jgi:hypothetical protein
MVVEEVSMARGGQRNPGHRGGGQRNPGHRGGGQRNPGHRGGDHRNPDVSLIYMSVNKHFLLK